MKCLSVQNCCVARQIAFFPGAHSVKEMTNEEIIRELVSFHKSNWLYSYFVILNSAQNKRFETLLTMFGYKKYPFCSKKAYAGNDMTVWMYIFDRESDHGYMFRRLNNPAVSVGDCPCGSCENYRQSQKTLGERTNPILDKFKEDLVNLFGIVDHDFLLKLPNKELVEKRDVVMEYTVQPQVVEESTPEIAVVVPPPDPPPPPIGPEIPLTFTPVATVTI